MLINHDEHLLCVCVGVCKFLWRSPDAQYNPDVTVLFQNHNHRTYADGCGMNRSWRLGKETGATDKMKNSATVAVRVERRPSPAPRTSAPGKSIRGADLKPCLIGADRLILFIYQYNHSFLKINCESNKQL